MVTNPVFVPQALVDGPCSGVRRQAMNFNKLWLTDFMIQISPSAREKQVKKRLVEGDILAKWEKTSWAKKITMQKRRRALTDFDRFKLKVLKQQVHNVQSIMLVCLCFMFLLLFIISRNACFLLTESKNAERKV